MSGSAAQACFIVGFGNRQRRDDGVGPWIVERLEEAAAHLPQVHLLTLPQFAADTVADLQEADLLLFVDASVASIPGGRRWRKLIPDLRQPPYLTHHVPPAFLLGLMEKLYGRAAPAWLVSVQGSDFGYGEGLSSEAARTAARVSREISRFIESSRFRVKDSRSTAEERGPYESKYNGVSKIPPGLPLKGRRKNSPFSKGGQGDLFEGVYFRN